MDDYVGEFGRIARLFVAGIVFLITMRQIVVPTARSLMQLRDSPGPEGFWAAREWIVVFALFNAIALAFSLFNALSEMGVGFFEVLLEHSLVCAQVGALVLASALLIGSAQTDGHVVRPVAQSERWTWVGCLLMAIAGNMLAAIDSVESTLVGPWHQAIWIAENALTILFFAIPFLLFCRGRFATLGSSSMGRLWWIVAALAVLVILDTVVPLGV